MPGRLHPIPVPKAIFQAKKKIFQISNIFWPDLWNKGSDSREVIRNFDNCTRKFLGLKPAKFMHTRLSSLGRVSARFGSTYTRIGAAGRSGTRFLQGFPCRTWIHRLMQPHLPLSTPDRKHEREQMAHLSHLSWHTRSALPPTCQVPLGPDTQQPRSLEKIPVSSSVWPTVL